MIGKNLFVDTRQGTLIHDKCSAHESVKLMSPGPRGRFFGILLFGSLSACCMFGCATSSTTRFYVLSQPATSQGASGTNAQNEEPSQNLSPAKEAGRSSPSGLAAQHALGIRLIAFPEYLDRPQIVVRQSSGRLALAEFDRWAEPLKSGFMRQLRDNLHELTGRHVVDFPWRRDETPTAFVDIALRRFERDPDGNVQLAVDWFVRTGDPPSLLMTRRHTGSVPVQAPGFEPLVRAMSEAVMQFSRKLAAEAVAEMYPGAHETND